MLLPLDLMAYGINTAYDVMPATVARVHGFGPKLTQTVMNWRFSIEQRAKANMPTDLDATSKNAIRNKYAGNKLALETGRNRLQSQLTQEETGIRQRFDIARQPLDQEQAAAQTKSEQQRQEIAHRFAQQYAGPTQAIAQYETQLVEKCRQVDAQSSELKKEIFACNWRLAKIEHELTAYKYITFARYLRAVYY